MRQKTKLTKSALLFTQKLPSRQQFGPNSLLLYDRRLSTNRDFKSWAQEFNYKIPLTAGEKLKSLEAFTAVLNKITKLNIPQTTKLTFVAAGGGSVGDFTGFLASVYLRGRPLVLLPSTWLAAVDSAHGGKNGLNLGGAKNQIGTFHLPLQTVVCSELLSSQPRQRLAESYGEMLKIAILADKKLFFKLLDIWDEPAPEHLVIQQLPHMIALKNKIVQKDPMEQNGHRRLLNLGHTVGHLIESQTSMAHGHAVALGLHFSARWSYQRGWLSESDYISIAVAIENLGLKLRDSLVNIPASELARLLARDKKITSEETIDFIFIKKIGSCFRQKVKVSEIVSEIQRQLAEG